MKNNKQKFGDLGQHWTADKTIDLMISLIKNHGSILEPAAGSGKFVQRFPECIAIEIDELVIPNNLREQYIICNFFDYEISNLFETIIGNPPYVAGKLLDQEWFSNWKGISPKNSNSYIHFIEKCISHLEDNGELIFIVPSSFLSATSRGKELRKKMVLEGAFTDIIIKNVEWEEAAIETLIFRWQKGLKQGIVKTDKGNIHLYEKNGFIWLLNFNPLGVLGDYFKATVGSAPLKEDVENGNFSSVYGEYVLDGKFIKVCEKRGRKN